MTYGVDRTKRLGIGKRYETEQDVLITLNTGAGKTIVGLLIAQSLVNEKIENVIYVCSTIDLVFQTADGSSSHRDRLYEACAARVFQTICLKPEKPSASLLTQLSSMAIVYFRKKTLSGSNHFR